MNNGYSCVDGFSGYCEDGTCTVPCDTGPDCLLPANRPANSHEVTAGCSNQYAECYACNTNYHWDNGACVPDSTCDSDCSQSQANAGTTQCKSDIVQTCTTVEPECYQWVDGVDCEDNGQMCSGGSCVDDCDSYDDCDGNPIGTIRCQSDPVQSRVCAAVAGTCKDWDAWDACPDGSGDAECWTATCDTTMGCGVSA